jgi:hypothetical protein
MKNWMALIPNFRLFCEDLIYIESLFNDIFHF